MKDIIVRLAYSHPLCTCLTKTHEYKFHGELCMYRVVRDAEDELLRLTAENRQLKACLTQNLS